MQQLQRPIVRTHRPSGPLYLQKHFQQLGGMSSVSSSTSSKTEVLSWLCQLDLTPPASSSRNNHPHPSPRRGFYHDICTKKESSPQHNNRGDNNAEPSNSQLRLYKADIRFETNHCYLASSDDFIPSYPSTLDNDSDLRKEEHISGVDGDVDRWA